MKDYLRPFLLSIFLFLYTTINAEDTKPVDTKPDTVSIGIYITSIHDIDFKQKEYSVNLWVWLKYKKKRV